MTTPILTIFADPGLESETRDILHREPRLDELAEVASLASRSPAGTAAHLLVTPQGIGFPLDWQQFLPPYLLPEWLPLKAEVLLGIVMARLGNYDKSRAWLEAYPALRQELEVVRRMQEGQPVDPDELVSEYSEFEAYRLMHNNAIVRHYASAPDRFSLHHTRYFYEEALHAATDEVFRAFTALHYATLLTDTGDLDYAEAVLRGALSETSDPFARVELQNALNAAWMRKLTAPYDPELLDALKHSLWEVLQVYEQQERSVPAALALVDASYIANICDSFAESLGYINRAIEIFRREEIPELLANAEMRKGTLLYTWAKQGNPQFYRMAVNAFQEALKVYTREDTPEVFAEIHHYLGVIYSEIPDEARKKSVWAAISSASFQEALQVFTRETHPYEYAMVCNSYGNALTKYPDAVRSDNFTRALAYYQEALDIRTAKDYPLERALTLLNHIEACWYAGNDPDQFNEGRYLDMVAKALEVKELTDDPRLLADAQRHLEKLDELRESFA
ncbi:MAG: hypothetical protein NW241_04440 [Bacteroidia bacterium]|nr:hypothetical protein [Bacteroidia bacterium]